MTNPEKLYIQVFSLYDYQKFRIHSNYQLTGSINLSANVSWLQNTSPLPNKQNFLSHAESASLQWNPKGAKRFGFLGTWEHSILRSNIFTPNEPGSYPVILLRLPYNKDVAQTYVYASPGFYASHCYIVVVQDVDPHPGLGLRPVRPQDDSGPQSLRARCRRGVGRPVGRTLRQHQRAR